MTVYFIGAGPGAADLITLRGFQILQRCPLCLYAGSLVAPELIAPLPPEVRAVDTASLVFSQIMDLIVAAHEAGEDVARLHSGDSSLYGATGEQMRFLKSLEIPYEIVPGVPAFAAAAAALECELTLPGIAQTVILTRTSMKASAMPVGEELSALAKSGATLAIHLSVRNLGFVCEHLIPQYGENCPVAIVYRASWPDQKIVRGVLGDIRKKLRAEKITRTALILVGPVLTASDFSMAALYNPEHVHLLRPKKSKIS